MATILNDVTCQRGGEYYARCDWLLSMIYYSTDTQMTSRETPFLCFV